MERITDGQGVQIATTRIAAGLQLLLQSRQLAQEVKRDIWEFSVEKQNLNTTGVSNSDLRWMICRGLIEHAIEVTEHSVPNRQFRAGTELGLEDRSCFILTAEGERFARKSAFSISSNGAKHEGTVARWSRVDFENLNGTSTHSAARVSTPTWDSARHQLRVGSTIVKEYKLPSPNQEKILAAFEEEGWPPCIDDPLPVHPDLDPKRRLHDTIKSLNRNQRSRKIRFMGDGTGEGARWEWMGPESTDD